MKSYLLKIVTCLLFAGMFQLTNAQTLVSKPAQPASAQLDMDQTARANEITERIAGEVQLTNTQKTKLQSAMQQAIATYSAAVKKARKEDESKLASVNSGLVADITAKIKGILTPEQFNTVMTKESTNQ